MRKRWILGGRRRILGPKKYIYLPSAHHVPNFPARADALPRSSIVFFQMYTPETFLSFSLSRYFFNHLSVDLCSPRMRLTGLA